MKKGLLALLVLGGGFAVYWFFIREKPAPSGPPPKPLDITTNTSAFSGSFDKMLNTYYVLRDAFVKSDPGTVDIVASQFRFDVDTLNVKELKADPAIISTAQNLKESVSAEIQAMLKTPGIEDKRKSFQIVSDAIYDLIRTVKFDKGMVYQLHCPMAFNNAGANWLSNKDEVINPYFGDKMLHCGEAIDSLDFRPPPPPPAQ
ncbi:MAG: DUF3347 domain-containing protein [Chitinophagaceae bacterium]